MTPNPVRPILLEPRMRSRKALAWAASLGLTTVFGSLVVAGDDTPARKEARAEVAAAPTDSTRAGTRADVVKPGRPADVATSAEMTPILQARQIIGECQTSYDKIKDYTCTFYKRERIDGKLYQPHVIELKARTQPSSLYFKFIQPNRGREAIFIHGQNDNKIVAHDVGIGRFLAGTMHLDPRGGMAMEENRHPVTEAGLGSMIHLVKERWDQELTPGESVLEFNNQVKVGDRPCTLIVSIHPRKHENFLFHKVKLYVDREHKLPIRFEAYDWPRRPGAEPELLEDYTYADLKTNVGLTEHDFDPANKHYSYGRF